MKSLIKNLLLRPLLSSVCLTFLHPVPSFAMDPKVAREATEKIVSGVKNSLVLGQRTGDARESEQVIKNSGGSIKKVEDNLSISSSASVRNSRTAVVPTPAASAMARNISSSSSSSRLSARYNSTREAIQKKSGECRNEGAGITTSSSTSVRNSRTAVASTSAVSAMARNMSSSSSSRLSARYDSTQEAIQKKSAEFKIKEKTPQGFQAQVITEATIIPVQAVEQIKIEKKATECYQKATEAVAIGKQSKKDTVSFSTASENSQIAKVELKRQQAQAKYEEALKKGNQELAALWRDIIFQSEKAAEYYEKSAEAEVEGNVDVKSRSNNNVKKAQEIYEEALEKGDQELAASWRYIISDCEKVAESYAKSTEVVIVGNADHRSYWNNQKRRWNNAAKALESSVERLESAAEAFEKATIATTQTNHSLAALWRDVISQSKKAAEYYKKYAEAEIVGSNIAWQWKNAAESLEFSVEDLELAVDAFEKAAIETTQSNQQLAVLWNNKVARHQKAAEYYQKAADKTEDFQQKEACGLAAKTMRSSASSLELAAQAVEKVAIAKTQSNQKLVALWQEIATQHQKVAEYSRQSAEVVLVGNSERNINESLQWRYITGPIESSVHFLESAVEAAEKAALATTQSNHSLALLWQKTMIQDQEASEYYQKTSEAMAKNNEKKSDWKMAAEKMGSSASSLKLAAQAFEKASTVPIHNNQEVLALWQEIATQHEKAAEYYRRSAEVTIVKCATTNWFILQNAAQKISSTISCLKSSVNAVEKASIAMAQSNQSLAALWQRIAIDYQEQAQYYRKSTEAIANDTKESTWDDRAESMSSIIVGIKVAAEAVEKTARATTPSNQQLAVLCQKITTQHQEAGKYYRKYFETRVTGNQTEGNPWYDAAQNINSSIAYLTWGVESLEKAAIATTQNNLPLAALWQEIITQYQEVAKCYQQSAEAIATGNTEEERRSKEATEVIHYNISRLKSAPEILQEAIKKAAEYHQKAAEAGTVGNVDEECQWEEAAKSIESSKSYLQLAARALGKISIARTQNNQPLVILWQKIASQYQEAAEYHRKSAEVVATGNAEEMGELRKTLNKSGIKVSSLSLNFITSITSEALNSMRKMERFSHMAGSLWNSAGYLESAVSALEKANIATTKGDQAVATALQYLASVRQKIAELYKRTIKGIEEGDPDWCREFEVEFEYEDSSEKYYEEQVRRLEEESNAKAAVTVQESKNPTVSFKRQKSIFTR